MELRDAEAGLGIEFPKLFHAINDSGMMDYLSHSREWGRDRAAREQNAPRQEDFFGECMGDCQLLAFEALPEACEELYECLRSDLEIYPERQSLNPLYRLVPFARMISGDQYCFLYEGGETEPKIVVYGHDTGDVDLWADSFEEFVYFQIVAEVVDWDKELHSDYIKAHVQWLSDAHKRSLEQTPIADIWEGLPAPQEFNIWAC